MHSDDIWINNNTHNGHCSIQTDKQFYCTLDC